MRRCPQCEFIYPDTDSVCDFDQTPLVDASESEIAAITNTPERIVQTPRSRRTLPIALAVGLLLGITAVGVYFAVRRQMRPQPVQEQVRAVPTPSIQLASPSPSPSIIETPSPEVAVASPERSASPTTKTAHTTTSTGPVSTGTSITAKSGGKQVILLTSGGRVEADEVWRTKDGVWYRKDGVVTLLKKNRVKAIVNQ